MISLENARPSTKMILNHLDEFEASCTGNTPLSPAKFREINTELSVGAVMMLGKLRYQNDFGGKRVYWRGPDNKEHDLGLAHDANVLRDYPGFNARRTLSLGSNMVSEDKVIENPNGNGHLSVVTMQDGSIGIGPNYRMALRNAALRMHLTSKFNFASLSGIWNHLWGNA